jgi:cytochrome c peroxidase
VDGLSRGLPNDDPGNARDVKSVVFCFQAPLSIGAGARPDAAAAVRAEMNSIGFTSTRKDVAPALNEFIKSLQPLPSPHLVHNQFSAAASRGQKLFLSKELACSQCHVPPLFTDFRSHATGTGNFDLADKDFYTPALIELWRTAPYLHDGSAAGLKDVVITHGMRSAPKKVQLTGTDIEDLVAYLQTL